MTANDIIRRALRLIGAIDPGEVPTPQEASDGLIALNGYVGQLATQRLAIYVTERAVFPLVSGQQEYTIGVGGHFNRQRPIYFPFASVLSYTDSDLPLELPLRILSTQQWQSYIPQKGVTSQLPTMIYYNNAYAAGLGSIFLFPIPTGSALSVVLYLPTALSEFASLSTAYVFPPGYADMLAYNLAVRIAPEYLREVPKTVSALAIETLGNVKRANITIEEATCDPGIVSSEGGLWNYITGAYVGSPWG